MKKLIIGIIAAGLLTAAGILILSMADTKNPSQEIQQTVINTETEKEITEEPKKEETKEEQQTEKKEEETKQPENSEDDKVYKPTFMYFISNSDADFEQTNKTIENLKKKYDGKITFDVVNIDEKPDAKENFPVDGQTPALIMLNTKNDICAFEFKCSDEEKLDLIIKNSMK